MFVHLADAVTKGFNKVLLCTVDTNVVVLAVAAAARINVQELWVAFGTAKSWHIPVHDITRSLGPSKSIALPMFYACTGYDTVSSFGTKGKKTSWITRMNIEEVTPISLLSLWTRHI